MRRIIATAVLAATAALTAVTATQVGGGTLADGGGPLVSCCHPH
jgi:hypothetical protein